MSIIVSEERFAVAFIAKIKLVEEFGRHVPRGGMPSIAGFTIATSRAMVGPVAVARVLIRHLIERIDGVCVTFTWNAFEFNATKKSTR